MSWLTEFVRPKISSLGLRKEHPEHFWTKCGQCESMLFHRDLKANHQVCTVCGHHMRLGATERLKMLFDQGQYSEAELPKVAQDPLRFRDRKKYGDRLKDAQNKTGRQDALIVAHGKMGGQQAVVSAFDFSFMGGSMGTAVGESFIRGAELALAQSAPYIVIPASGGARMQEGVLSLMQMPRTLVAVQKLREAGLPYVVIFTDPTTGGVSASFAMAGDIHLAEPGATIGFAGARVIQDTIRESLPEGFQTAEYLLDHGMVDMVVKRTEMRETLIGLLDVIMQPKPKGEVVNLQAHQVAAEAAASQPALAAEQQAEEAASAEAKGEAKDEAKGKGKAKERGSKGDKERGAKGDKERASKVEKQGGSKGDKKAAETKGKDKEKGKGKDAEPAGDQAGSDTTA